jgi:DNA-binding XRE family transcriptional regulator
MSPESHARAQAKTSEMLKELALSELRRIKQGTQQELAKLMDVNQAAISKLERRAEFPDCDVFAVVLGAKKRKRAA